MYKLIPNRLIEREGITLLFIHEHMLIFELDDVSTSIVKWGPNIEESDLNTIARTNKYDLSAVKEAIKELVSLGILRQAEAANDLHGRRRREPECDKFIGAIWLTIAQDCNLRCKYCSAGYGLFGGSQPSLLSEKMARRAVEFLFDHVKPGSKYVSILFTGGEPLLNFGVLRSTIEYVNAYTRDTGIGVKWQLNTNGTLVTAEIAQFLIENKVSVTVSIDGPEHVHDRSRIYRDGTGSFCDTMRGYDTFKQFLEGRTPRIQSVLVDSSELAESIRFLYNQGAKVFVANPVFNSRFVETNYNFSLQTDYQFYEQYKTLSEVFTKHNISNQYVGFSSALNFYSALENRTIKDRVCGAGASVAITTDGTFYACQGVLGRKELQFGSIQDGFDFDKRAAFREKLLSFSDKCKACFGRNFCGGGCYAIALYEGTVDADEPTKRCDLYKLYIDDAIFSYYKLKVNNAAFLKRFKQVKKHDKKQH